MLWIIQFHELQMYLSTLKLKMLINDKFHSNFTFKIPIQADEMKILHPLSIHKLKERKGLKMSGKF
jgi:hypothetical protein